MAVDVKLKKIRNKTKKVTEKKRTLCEYWSSIKIQLYIIIVFVKMYAMVQ